MDRIYLTDALSSKHRKEGFDCGQDLLNGYIRRQASQDVKRRIAACFILAGENGLVMGYYTLSSASIARDNLPSAIIRKLPGSYSDLPVTLLGRLAVDNAHKGKGLGEALLADALKRACYASVQSVASMAIVVDPIDQNAQNFYTKYGFIKLPDSGKMFVTMETVAKLFLPG
jgi:predicted GNAT family N-acyltransferase